MFSWLVALIYLHAGIIFRTVLSSQECSASFLVAHYAYSVFVHYGKILLFDIYDKNAKETFLDDLTI